MTWEEMVLEYPGPPPARVRFLDRLVLRGRMVHRQWSTEFRAQRPVAGAMRVAPEGGDSFYGAHDIEIGDRRFDDRFVVQSNPPSLARSVLTHAVCRQVERMPPPFVLEARPGDVRVCVGEYLADIALAHFVNDCYALVARLPTGVRRPSRARYRCAVCGARVTSADGYRCRACKAPHHARCWRHNGGCSTFACGERRLLRQRRAGAAGPRPVEAMRLDGPPSRAIVRFYHHDLSNWRIHYTEFFSEAAAGRFMRVVTPDWHYGVDFAGGEDIRIGVPEFDRRYVLQGDVSALVPAMRPVIERLDGMGTGPFLFELRPRSVLVRVSHRLRRVTAMQEFVGACHALVAAAVPRLGVRIHAVEHRAGGRCPVCGVRMDGRVVACRACRTPHHEECWSYNDGCATFACGGVDGVRR